MRGYVSGLFAAHADFRAWMVSVCGAIREVRLDTVGLWHPSLTGTGGGGALKNASHGYGTVTADWQGRFGQGDTLPAIAESGLLPATIQQQTRFQNVPCKVANTGFASG